MKGKNNIINRRNRGIRQKFKSCICSGELFKAVEMGPSSESQAGKQFSASDYSSKAGESEKEPADTGNIEEAEWSLRETSSLNYEVSLFNIPHLPSCI